MRIGQIGIVIPISWLLLTGANAKDSYFSDMPCTEWTRIHKLGTAQSNAFDARTVQYLRATSSEDAREWAKKLKVQESDLSGARYDDASVLDWAWRYCEKYPTKTLSYMAWEWAVDLSFAADSPPAP